MTAIYHTGDWLMFRTVGQGCTLGKLGKDWGGEQQVCFSQAYHVQYFEIEDSQEDTLATLAWKKPKSVQLYGGAPAVLNETGLAWYITDEQADNILEFLVKN